MKKVKRFFIILFIFLVFSTSGFLLYVSNHYVVPILMYHNIENDKPEECNWTSPALFEWHLQYINKHGYRVVALDGLVSAQLAEKLPSRNTLVITFDDGHINNYTDAFPLLKKYDFPAIMFIPSDRIGTEGHMAWEQIREMADYGIEIGSHGRTGGYLPDFSDNRKWDEINESKKLLEEKLGIEIKYFAYPLGGFSPEIKEMIKKAGYKGAVATNRGFDRDNKDVFELNRVRLSNKDIKEIYLWSKFSGYYNLFRESKNPF